MLLRFGNLSLSSYLCADLRPVPESFYIYIFQRYWYEGHSMISTSNFVTDIGYSTGSSDRLNAPFLKGGRQKIAADAEVVSADDPKPRVLLGG